MAFSRFPSISAPRRRRPPSTPEATPLRCAGRSTGRLSTWPPRPSPLRCISAQQVSMTTEEARKEGKASPSDGSSAPSRAEETRRMRAPPITDNMTAATTSRPARGCATKPSSTSTPAPTRRPSPTSARRIRRRRRPAVRLWISADGRARETSRRRSRL